MIYTSTKHLLTHGPNASFGNHILHLLYTINVAHHRKLGVGIGCDSNLDMLFDLSKYKMVLPSSAVCLFAEQWGDTIEKYAEKEQRNLKLAQELLKGEMKIPQHFWVEGWFQHQSTLPTLEIFNSYVTIRKNWLDFVDRVYPFLRNSDQISLHYRGTDFSNANGWGDCRLGVGYYTAALDYIKKYHPHIKTVNIFSDDLDTAASMLVNSGLQYKCFKNAYDIDWLCLFLSKNLISSNSSFAFSAGRYNKELVIQPKNFLLRGKSEICFPVDPYYENSVVL